MKLKKGDTVKIIKGKDQGKTGKIEKVLSKVNKVLIAGVNQYKRHLKARSQKQPSEIATIIKPLPLMNVMFVCPKCHLPARIGYMTEDEKKIRICKKCKQKL
ncbi:MAG: 50S ribosomal protein L24 [Candidatus Levybacteria bacterium RIFCSPHIGHO2_02_FULL_37_13]|nr:MAG: 50S ribosomal protein L24 [Candidatus Levybacteria bacterium RIFCSPHIGHO2_02_FULL_37_13]OGH30457.1 MAG: 50S ribosomal protein L24 [Candidatus Levybacteria bacterium RIFCSPHIGHO2_12_FULL_37_9]OGH40014.1 MAG: 50S ribosomal protein L24 [Candidatus Levybacteria bacterium RIFCSPLOWO2_01_FULL_37_26]